MVAINSNLAVDEASRQYAWLKSDLARKQGRCTLTFWPDARFPAPKGACREWPPCGDSHVMPAFADRILPVDVAVAQRCARLHVPDPRAERDALIAATALVHDLTVVTRNVGDFHATDVALLNAWN